MKKYSEFGAKFKSALKLRGWKLKNLSKETGIKLPTLGNYSRGANIPEGENREKLQKLLGLRESDFLPDAALKPNARIAPPLGPDFRSVPVISWARAGSATDYEDMMNFIEEYTITQAKDPNAFALIVEGDSMEKSYLAGDLIVCAPGDEPRNGKPVVARLRGQSSIPNTGGVLFKRFFREGTNGESIRLESDNPHYEPLRFKREDFWFIYPIVTMVRKER